MPKASYLRSTGEFKAVEFNGIGAEPAHIYDPEYPVWKKYRDIYRHWRVIFEIYKIQAANGVEPMTRARASILIASTPITKNHYRPTEMTTMTKIR